MKQKIFPLNKQKIILLFILTFLLSSLIGFFVVAILHNSRSLREKERASSMVDIMVSRLSHVIDKALSIPQTVKALLIEGDGTIVDFEILMPEIVGDTPIRYAALAPNGIISEIYPRSGNEKALGYNLLEDPEQILQASLASDKEVLTLLGPYRLLLGGVGLVGRVPVYLDSGDSPYFWGFSSVTINLPDGLREAGLEQLESQGYAYELWCLSPDTDEKLMIAHSKFALSSSPVESVIHLPNSNWTLSISPIQGWGNIGNFYFDLAVVFLIALLASFLVQNILALADRKNKLQATLKRQSANYQLMNHLNDDLRIFRHDINNHMLSLSYLLKKGDTNAAIDYIAFISGAMSDSLSIVNTENYVFDALMAQKISKAGDLGIQVEKDVTIEKQLDIDNEDWSILFGNILDNAIEACIQSEIPSPMLRIVVKYHSGMLQSMITNTSARKGCPNTLPVVTFTDELLTSKEDKKNHGLGIKQIQAVIKKYHGTMEIVREDNLFILAFTLFQV